MNTTIHTKIRESIKEAMKAKDTIRLETNRGLLAMFTNESVALGKTPQDLLSDEDAINVIKRAIKQRKDSIEQFTNAGRTELADKEQAELDVLTPLVPETMKVEDIQKIAIALKEKLAVTDKSKMGILIGAIIKESNGKADGGDVKEVV